jgi:hypothetical protein
MKLDLYLFQIAVLFLPGVIWARLDASWAQRAKPTDTEFLIRSFLFGVTSYVVTYLLFLALHRVAGLDTDFVFISLQDMSLTPRIAVEVAAASAVGFALGIVWLFAVNHKWIARFLQHIGATKRFGDEDIWDFTFNSRSPAVEYVHLRDFEQKVVYAGYVNAFSETEKLRELVIRDVTVYDFEGNTMYSVPLLYLSRKPEGVHIEFPYGANGAQDAS